MEKVLENVKPLTIKYLGFKGSEVYVSFNTYGEFVEWCFAMANAENMEKVQAFEKINKNLTKYKLKEVEFADSRYNCYESVFNNLFELWNFIYTNIYR